MKNNKYNSLLFGFIIIFICFSCKKENINKIDTSEFILQKGFEIELVASEPLLDSPMAMQFDKKGRIWVVELPGYMRDIDGSDEELDDGKIVILTDKNGDGKMDERIVFLDGLVAPRAILPVYGGLLYTDKTSLWWASIKNNQPGEKILVDSLYVIGGNIEHQPNGLLYNLDNWIYSAKSNARYKRKNGKWQKEATLARGQWGLTNDDQGRLYFNDNSNPLYGDYMMPNILIKNPYQKIRNGMRQQIATDRRVFPYQATAVNRGYEDGVLDSAGMLTNFTSSCAPLIYRGNQFPEDFYGNAFVCGPEVNLVKRYLVDYGNIKTTAVQAYEGEEFLISKEEAFRPVNLYNGLDGNLYICDLRKGVIQHRAYMTPYLRDTILDRGLEKIYGIGRIYKVSPSNYKENAIDYSNYKTADFIPLLGHKNGALRILAQQEIINSRDVSLKTELIDLVKADEKILAQVHALWVLEGMGILETDLLLEIINTSENSDLINQCLNLINSDFNLENFEILSSIVKNYSNGFYLCSVLGMLKNNNADKLWVSLAEKYKDDKIYCEALISGINGREEYFLKKIKTLKNNAIYSMLTEVISNKKNKELKAPYILTETYLDNRTAGFQTYNTYCLSCHGRDGKGNLQLAPPLYPSDYVQGPPEKLILIALQGLKGPVHVNGKKYDMNLVMPGIKNNPELTDKKIADLMVFVKNSFTTNPTHVSEEMVKEIRVKLEGNDEMFTEGSLNNWMEENGY